MQSGFLIVFFNFYCFIKELNKVNSPFSIMAAAKSKIKITDMVIRIPATGPSMSDTFGTNNRPITAKPANILAKYMGILLLRKVMMIPPYPILRSNGLVCVGMRMVWATNKGNVLPLFLINKLLSRTEIRL